MSKHEIKFDLPVPPYPECGKCGKTLLPIIERPRVWVSAGWRLPDHLGDQGEYEPGPPCLAWECSGCGHRVGVAKEKK